MFRMAALHHRASRKSPNFLCIRPFLSSSPCTRLRSELVKSVRRRKYCVLASSSDQPMRRAKIRTQSAPLLCLPCKQCNKTLSPCMRAPRVNLTARSTRASHVNPSASPRSKPMCSQMRTQSGCQKKTVIGAIHDEANMSASPVHRGAAVAHIHLAHADDPSVWIRQAEQLGTLLAKSNGREKEREREGEPGERKALTTSLSL